MRPLFGLVMGNVFFGVTVFLMVPYGWQIGIANIVISIGVLGFGLWLSYHVRRASHFQAFQVFWTSLAAIQLLILATLLATQSIGNSWWILTVVVTISSLLGGLWQYHDVRQGLRQTRQYNDSHGCFKRTTAMWFPGRRLHIRIPNSRPSTFGAALGRWGLVIAIILTQIVARSGQALIIETGLLFLTTYGSLLAVAYRLGVMGEILELEGLWGRSITVGDAQSQGGERA